MKRNTFQWKIKCNTFSAMRKDHMRLLSNNERSKARSKKRRFPHNVKRSNATPFFQWKIKSDTFLMNGKSNATPSLRSKKWNGTPSNERSNATPSLQWKRSNATPLTLKFNGSRRGEVPSGNLTFAPPPWLWYHGTTKYPLACCSRRAMHVRLHLG